MDCESRVARHIGAVSNDCVLDVLCLMVVAEVKVGLIGGAASGRLPLPCAPCYFLPPCPVLHCASTCDLFRRCTCGNVAERISLPCTGCGCCLAVPDQHPAACKLASRAIFSASVRAAYRLEAKDKAKKRSEQQSGKKRKGGAGGGDDAAAAAAAGEQHQQAEAGGTAPMEAEAP